MHVNLNGSVINTDITLFSSENRAFRYGDGLFESIRVFDGKMPFFDLHWHRLSMGFELLKYELPAFFSPNFFENEIQKLTQGHGNWRIRLTVWRGGAGLYTPESNIPEFLIEATPLPSAVFELNENGLNIGLFDQALLHHQPLSILKTTSALPYVLASIFKKENQLDDCLMPNTAGRPVCGSSSNFFWVKDDELSTPPLTEGCIAGTMRGAVLALAGQLGIMVSETPITMDELKVANEIFLTNAIQGIRWVQTIPDRSKPFNFKTARMLNDALNQFLKSWQNQLMPIAPSTKMQQPPYSGKKA